jgi:hypothetical protein
VRHATSNSSKELEIGRAPILMPFPVQPVAAIISVDTSGMNPQFNNHTAFPDAYPMTQLWKAIDDWRNIAITLKMPEQEF